MNESLCNNEVLKITSFLTVEHLIFTFNLKRNRYFCVEHRRNNMPEEMIILIKYNCVNTDNAENIFPFTYNEIKPISYGP